METATAAIPFKIACVGFSLPMRDGNVSGTAREVREEQVLAYL